MTPTPATTPQSPSVFDPAAGNDGPESADLAEFAPVLRSLPYEHRLLILDTYWMAAWWTSHCLTGMGDEIADEATDVIAELLDEVIA